MFYMGLAEFNYIRQENDTITLSLPLILKSTDRDQYKQHLRFVWRNHTL